jgi:hypothetical protein
MKSSLRIKLLGSFFLALAVPGLALAGIMETGPVDELVARRGATVVLGKVESVTNPSECSGFREFRLSVTRVLKGDPAKVPASLALHTHVWPLDFDFPLEKGRTGIFVLCRSGKGFEVFSHERAILPAPQKTTGALLRKALLRIIADSLVRYAEEVDSPWARALLISVASDACGPEHKKTLLGYLGSAHAWVRRAARGALLRLTGAKEHLREAEKDFASFFSSTPDFVEVNARGGQVMKTSAFHLFFEMYRDVEHAARGSGAERGPGYLSLFRTVSDLCPDSHHREVVGLGGLGIFGSRDDLARLYGFTGHPDAGVRQKAHLAVSRILNLGIRHLPAEDFAKIEKAQEKSLREEILKQGYCEVE